jgi:hypothetical protein
MSGYRQRHLIFIKASRATTLFIAQLAMLDLMSGPAMQARSVTISNN